jgi:general secretion pathway protein I
MTAQRGFTLVEAVIAVAILAVSLVALYEAMGTGFRTLDRAAAVEEAVLVAQSALDGTVALGQLPEARRGTAGIYAWRLDVGPEPEAASGALHQRAIRVTVEWPGGGRGVSIERLLLLPTERVTP